MRRSDSTTRVYEKPISDHFHPAHKNTGFLCLPIILIFINTDLEFDELAAQALKNYDNLELSILLSINVQRFLEPISPSVPRLRAAA